MKMEVFTVYDKAVLAYMQPFYARHVGEAIRSFTELANNPETNVGRHPTDFTLFHLGRYDDGTGLFEGNAPARVIDASEVVRDAAIGPNPHRTN